MKKETLRCGIVGTGAFANIHAQAIHHLPAIHLAAACDTEQEHCQKFTKKWGGEMYRDIKEMLQQKPFDIFVIATSNVTHATLIEEIVSHPHAPRLLIVEKPLCISQKELDHITTILQNTETILVVDHTRRFNKGFQKIHSLIHSQSLGPEVLSVSWRYHAGWLHTGVHAVDTLRMLLGELHCIRATKGSDDRFDNDPLLDIELRSNNHPNAIIQLKGIPETHYKVFEGEIFLSNGRIRIQFGDVFIDHARDENGSTPLLLFSEHFTVESTEKSIENFYTLCMDTLLKGDTHLLEIAGFDTARSTMDILFEAQSKAGL